MTVTAISGPQNYNNPDSTKPRDEEKEGKIIYLQAKNTKKQRTRQIRAMWKMRVKTEKYNTNTINRQRDQLLGNFLSGEDYLGL